MRMKCVGSLPRHSSMWPWPRGKCHTSPGSKWFVSAPPCGSKTVVRTRPLMTNVHRRLLAVAVADDFPRGLLQLELEGRQFLAREDRVGNVVRETQVADLGRFRSRH